MMVSVTRAAAADANDVDRVDDAREPAQYRQQHIDDLPQSLCVVMLAGRSIGKRACSAAQTLPGTHQVAGAAGRTEYTCRIRIWVSGGQGVYPKQLHMLKVHCT